MKIGLISGEFPPMSGGVGDFSRILGERLQAQGHDVFVLSRAGSVSTKLSVSTVSGWGAASLGEIRDWARGCDLDVANLQYQTAAFDMSPFIHFLPKAIRAPLITTFHDLRFPYLFPKAGPLRHWIVKQLARSSDGVITTNREDDQLLNSLPHRRVIPIGSSIRSRSRNWQDQARCRLELGADDDSFLLGHFGFIKAIKGVDYLIEALARIRHRGIDLRLVFIGGRSNTVGEGIDRDYLRALDERIRFLNLKEALHWTGYLPDEKVAASLNAVDLMVLPFEDGASYRRSSLIAAIHQGCAIVTTEPIVQEESFVHGCNLWLVPRRSAEGIEKAVTLLLSNHEQRKTLRAGALQLSKRFDWDVIARDTLAFYKACL